MTLPHDPMMLYSVINTLLRDRYPSFDALCDDLQADGEQLRACLAQAGFEYNEQQNRFW